MQVIESDIESVTVYYSGAAITRVAELAPAGGVWPSEVRVAGLPLALDDASVRIRMDANDAGGPRAVSFRVGIEVLDSSTVPDAPDEALRAARQEVLALEGLVNDAKWLAYNLSGMSVPVRPAPAEGAAPPPSPHAGRIALIEFQQQKWKAANASVQELGEKLRAAREALADLEDGKRRASNAREARPNELRKTVVVALSTPPGNAASSARLVLEYRVLGARWAPTYSVHFDQELSNATVSVRAVVAQRTGEDWRNVSLTLSSAQMQAWTELPELTSLRVGRWQSPPRSGWRSPPAGAEELYADYDREARAARAAVASRPLTEQLDRLMEQAREPEPGTDTAEFPAAAPEQMTAPASSTQPTPAQAAPPTRAMLVAEELPEGASYKTFAAPLPPPPPAPMAAAPAQMRVRLTRAATMRPASPAGEVTVAAMAFRAPGSPPLGQEPEKRLVPASLDYPALHMPGPDDAGRGRLARIDMAARLEVFAQLDVRVQVDAVNAVQAARIDAARLSGLPPAHTFPSSVEGFDYAYRAELAVDLPSDGIFHSIPLIAREGTARQFYVTVPREAPDVFRFAEIGNPLDAPLLSGPADIYAGNAFLMTVPLHITPSKGVIRLGLGVEQRIKVARNTAFAESASGLMSGTLNLKHDIHIEIRNQLRVPAQIEVRERVPVPRDGDDQIKVTTTAKPAWEPYDPPEGALRGGYVWKVQVQPAEALQLHAAYSISMPAKMEIATGNRREA
jgi:uncharacterized protein (TIGR02231 family)